ncbi:hypothetical protein GCM10012285_28050 [Streptomyces kronopolitis]|uniref:Transposase n=1 Tax=Streptomyces kronopolitis TaxID=1612435 RepID=A0ABQ2JCV6_9ACTN|nr:hypothetical protein GCM10012285_28050 [Streptomyces kronopolitis]
MALRSRLTASRNRQVVPQEGMLPCGAFRLRAPRRGWERKVEWVVLPARRQPTREFGSPGKRGGGDLYVTVHVTD